MGISNSEGNSHPAGDDSRERWEADLVELVERDRNAPWELGDHLLEGERDYGVTYERAAEISGLKKTTIYNRVSLSKEVPGPVRNLALSWAMHRPVAPLAADPEEQIHWLGCAADEGWTEEELRKAIEKAAASGGGSEADSDETDGVEADFPDPEEDEEPCSVCGGCCPHCGSSGVEPRSADEGRAA